MAEVFDELRAALGIAYVPLEFQAFAAYPEFLDLQWRAIRPLFATREFFDLAERLQAEAYTYVHNYFKVPPLGDGLTVSQATAVFDQICRVQPAVLLILSAQLQAFDASVGKPADIHPADRIASAPAPDFVDVESAPIGVRRVMEEIRHTLDLPFCGDEQRALAQWPDLLFAFWQTIKTMLQSVMHEDAIFRMRESAWNCAQEIPRSIEMEFPRLLEGGVNEEDIAIVTRLTELLFRGSAASVLNASFAKIGLEGGNRVETHSQGPAKEKVA
ncbi:MAG TPA: halocarboxylic acid dehydrogenase DehI family protein [Candidatus Koribacter sp.]